MTMITEGEICLRNDYSLNKTELFMCNESSLNSTVTAITRECPNKMHCLIETNFE
jgi:hypothetical protein